MKKNFLINIVKLLIIVFCFSFIFINLDQNFILKTFKRINFDFIFPSILFVLIYFFCYGLFIFKIYDYLFPSKLRLSTWLKIFINGSFLNSIPLLGFAYKGYRLNNYKISVKDYLFANIFITWLAISVLFIFFSLEIIFFVTPKISIFNIPVFLIFLFISISAFVSPKVCSYLLTKISFKIEILNSLFSFLQKNLSIKILRYYFSYGLLLHIFVFFIYFFIVKLLNIPISLKIIIVIFLINEVIDSIPFPNNNFLVTEILGGITATFIGVAFTEFVLIKFTFRIINLFMIIPVFLIVNILYKSEL